MTWVVFADRAAFDAYNAAACTARQIPRPGYRQSDQAPRMFNQWTLAAVDPFGVFTAPPATFVLANVPAADVATFSLTLAQNPPTQASFSPRTILWDGVTRTVFTTAPSAQQPKPATWTDPYTGITYNTTTGLPV